MTPAPRWYGPCGPVSLAAPRWAAEVARLGDAAGTAIGGYADLVRALEDRRVVFRAMGVGLARETYRLGTPEGAAGDST